MTGCGHASTTQDLFPKDSNAKDFLAMNLMDWLGLVDDLHGLTWIGRFASDFVTCLKLLSPKWILKTVGWSLKVFKYFNGGYFEFIDQCKIAFLKEVPLCESDL